MRASTKYFLFQIPGWLIALLTLVIATDWEVISTSTASVCLLCWVLKDLLLYPWLKLAYRSQPIGAKALVGSTGVADGDLTPEGFIRVRGERWRALVNPVDASIRAGAKVEITGADRMTVYVRALPENLSAK